MIQLPFGLAVVARRQWEQTVDHVARLLAERCALIVDHERDTAIIAAQQKVIRAQDGQLSQLRSAMADADRLLGISGDT